MSDPGTDVAPVTGKEVLLDPATGETLALDAPTERLAQWLDETRDLEQRIRSAKRVAYDELLRRMDARASWTVREGGYELTAPSPGRVEYDPAALYEALHDCVAAGMIEEGAAEAALEAVVTYKPKARGIQALLKLGGPVRDAINACAHPVEAPRNVRVKRSASS
jgi:hypothetical protein